MAEKEKEDLTIADKWIYRIDTNSAGRMQEDAVAEVEMNGAWVYIFEDGSSAYEKRRNDWYPAGQYVQCPECKEWRNVDDEETHSKLCDEWKEVEAAG
jgi:hypothetical protein